MQPASSRLRRLTSSRPATTSSLSLRRYSRYPLNRTIPTSALVWDDTVALDRPRAVNGWLYGGCVIMARERRRWPHGDEPGAERSADAGRGGCADGCHDAPALLDPGASLGAARARRCAPAGPAARY